MGRVRDGNTWNKDDMALERIIWGLGRFSVECYVLFEWKKF